MALIFYIFILLNYTTVFAQIQQGWIDPHEIVITDPAIFNMGENEQCVCPSYPNKIDHVTVHYKRVINLLLRSVLVDKNYSQNYSGRIYIKMSLENYNYLQEFAHGSENDAATLRKIDAILTKILTKPTQEELLEALFSWTDYIYITLYNRTTGILLAGVFICLLSYKLLKAKLTLGSVVLHLFFLAWVVDFAFTWINLLQEAEINKMADSVRYKSMPVHCDVNQMTVWQFIWNSFGSASECQKYHQTMFKEHFWSIAPFKVFSHQLGIVILTPASYIGEAIGTFSSTLYDTLPFSLKLIFFPLFLLFFIIMACILLSFLTNTSFGLNILHVIQFHFGNRERRALADSLTGDNLRNLFEIIQRHSIQNTNEGQREPQNVIENCNFMENHSNNLNREAIAGPMNVEDSKNRNDYCKETIKKCCENTANINNKTKIKNDGLKNNSGDKIENVLQETDNEIDTDLDDDNKTFCVQSDLTLTAESLNWESPNQISNNNDTSNIKQEVEDVMESEEKLKKIPSDGSGDRN